MLQSLAHPNIVTCTESFIAGGKLCIVMDFCENGDLYGFLKKRNGKLLEEDKLLDLFVQICLSMKHVHDRKILHRDLKTQNIFMSSGGILKLGDFGVAKVLSGTDALAATAVGTPYYLSPEICQNKKYNAKSDIWSLGCVLYEMTTLKHAFDANSLQLLIQKIIRGSFPPPPSTYSSGLRALITKMISTDPKKRPTINEILHEPILKQRIEKFLSNTVMNKEFSHTVIHGKPKPGALVATISTGPKPSPAASPSPTPSPGVSRPTTPTGAGAVAVGGGIPRAPAPASSPRVGGGAVIQPRRGASPIPSPSHAGFFNAGRGASPRVSPAASPGRGAGVVVASKVPGRASPVGAPAASALAVAGNRPISGGGVGASAERLAAERARRAEELRRVEQLKAQRVKELEEQKRRMQEARARQEKEKMELERAREKDRAEAEEAARARGRAEAEQAKQSEEMKRLADMDAAKAQRRDEVSRLEAEMARLEARRVEMEAIHQKRVSEEKKRLQEERQRREAVEEARRQKEEAIRKAAALRAQRVADEEARRKEWNERRRVAVQNKERAQNDLWGPVAVPNPKEQPKRVPGAFSPSSSPSSSRPTSRPSSPLGGSPLSAIARRVRPSSPLGFAPSPPRRSSPSSSLSPHARAAALVRAQQQREKFHAAAAVAQLDELRIGGASPSSSSGRALAAVGGVSADEARRAFSEAQEAAQRNRQRHLEDMHGPRRPVTPPRALSPVGQPPRRTTNANANMNAGITPEERMRAFREQQEAAARTKARAAADADRVRDMLQGRGRGDSALSSSPTRSPSPSRPRARAAALSPQGPAAQRPESPSMAEARAQLMRENREAAARNRQRAEDELRGVSTLETSPAAVARPRPPTLAPLQPPSPSPSSHSPSPSPLPSPLRGPVDVPLPSPARGGPIPEELREELEDILRKHDRTWEFLSPLERKQYKLQAEGVKRERALVAFAQQNRQHMKLEAERNRQRMLGGKARRQWDVPVTVATPANPNPTAVTTPAPVVEAPTPRVPSSTPSSTPTAEVSPANSETPLVTEKEADEFSAMISYMQEAYTQPDSVQAAFAVGDGDLEGEDPEPSVEIDPAERLEQSLREGESLAAKVEALRVFLEETLGEDRFYSAYRALEEGGQDGDLDGDGPETDQNTLQALRDILGEENLYYLRHIYQLIQCEAMLHQHGSAV